MEDDGCPNTIGSKPAGAIGSRVNLLTAYPPAPYYFVILDTVPDTTLLPASSLMPAAI